MVIISGTITIIIRMFLWFLVLVVLLLVLVLLSILGSPRRVLRNAFVLLYRARACHLPLSFLVNGGLSH